MMKSRSIALALSAIFGTTVGVMPVYALFPVTEKIRGDAIAQSPNSESYEETNIRVYEKASPAVVSIDSNKTNGSGTIISSDGMILTNGHVVAGNSTVTVIFADGKKLPGQVIGFGDEGLDLAVVKVQGMNNLPTLPLARPGSIKVGQRAFAIGNPFGRFQNTFTVGIVSRIDRQRGLIQTDAAINPGNSGGPLLNSAGELIGINTSIFTRIQGGGNTGISFAIPIDKIPGFIASVREGRASRVVRSRRSSLFGNVPPQKLTFNGSIIKGSFTSKSPVLPMDNSYFDLYSFEGKAGQQVTIEMKSQDIDSYLILLGSNQREIAQDDDGGGNKNARLVVTLPVDGTYYIIANSYDARENGNYTLELRETTATRSNRIILREEGILGQGSSVLPSDGSLYREYRFEGQAGQSVSISLESSDFDPYVAVFTPDSQLLGENDDVSDSSKNAFVSVTLPITGPYRVVVNSFDASGRGRYILTVR
jgi:S1-C subfamily serine protease